MIRIVQQGGKLEEHQRYQSKSTIALVGLIFNF